MQFTRYLSVTISFALLKGEKYVRRNHCGRQVRWVPIGDVARTQELPRLVTRQSRISK